MDYIFSIIFGFIQGLTEFLPVSSSGHLVVLHEIIEFQFADSLTFDVVLHAGTLLALVIYFFKDIIQYFLAFFKSFRKFDLKNNLEQRIAWFILAATLPAVFFGYFLEDVIESSFRSPLLVSLTLILGGFLFIIFEKIFSKRKNLAELNLKSSLAIGFFQVLALVPGVSRSGITILGGLSQKMKREEAARFAFLLAIPVTFGAVIKRASSLFASNIKAGDGLVLLLGFLAAFVSGYLVIKFLLNFLKNHSLNVFAYYRFILAAGVIVYFYFI